MLDIKSQWRAPPPLTTAADHNVARDHDIHEAGDDGHQSIMNTEMRRLRHR